MLFFLIKKGNIFKYFSLDKTLIIYVYICIGSEARFSIRPTEDKFLLDSDAYIWDTRQIKGYMVYYFGITMIFLNLGADYLK